MWGGRYCCLDSVEMDEEWNQLAVPAQAPPALHRKCLTGVTRSASSGNNHILLLEIAPSFTFPGCGCFPWMCGDDWAGHPRPAPGGEVELIPACLKRTCGSTAHPNQLFFPSSHFYLAEMISFPVSRRSQDFRGCHKGWRTGLWWKAKHSVQPQVFILYLEYSFCTHFHLMWDFLKPSSGAGYFHSESCKLAWGNSAWFTFFNLEKK